MARAQTPLHIRAMRVLNPLLVLGICGALFAALAFISVLSGAVIGKLVHPMVGFAAMHAIMFCLLAVLPRFLGALNARTPSS